MEYYRARQGLIGPSTSSTSPVLGLRTHGVLCSRYAAEVRHWRKHHCEETCTVRLRWIGAALTVRNFVSCLPVKSRFPKGWHRILHRNGMKGVTIMTSHEIETTDPYWIGFVIFFWDGSHPTRDTKAWNRRSPASMSIASRGRDPIRGNLGRVFQEIYSWIQQIICTLYTSTRYDTVITNYTGCSMDEVWKLSTLGQAVFDQSITIGWDLIKHVTIGRFQLVTRSTHPEIGGPIVQLGPSATVVGNDMAVRRDL